MLRLFAAGLIVLGSSIFGFGASSAVKRQMKTLRDLQTALFSMKNEMLYSMAELPDLLLLLSQKVRGAVGSWLLSSGRKLQNEPTASVTDVMMECLECNDAMTYSNATRSILYTLCLSLGKLDADGQIRAIDKALEELTAQRKYMEENRDLRVKSYRILGICAGLALAVVLL